MWSSPKAFSGLMLTVVRCTDGKLSQISHPGVAMPDRSSSLYVNFSVKKSSNCHNLNVLKMLFLHIHNIRCVLLLKMFIGLEHNMVHASPWPDAVLPEHRAGLDPLSVPLGVRPLLLPPFVLPWPRAYSSLRPLQRKTGEPDRRNTKLLSLTLY